MSKVKVPAASLSGAGAYFLVHRCCLLSLSHMTEGSSLGSLCKDTDPIREGSALMT